jgi:pilus assembly protein Flp/PilA
VLPWWPKEATLNLASEETLTLAGSSRYRWRNHLVMGGGIISLQVAASVGISIIHLENAKSFVGDGISMELKTMVSALKRFVADDSGATAIEYALIASLVAVAIIAALNAMSAKLQQTFNEVAGNLK